MKKRILLISTSAFIVVVLVVGGFVFFRQVPIIATPYTVATNNEGYSKSDLVVSQVKYNGTDITDKIDKERFASILSSYMCRRSFNNPFPYPTADMVWEMTLTHNFKPVHIVLGSKGSVRYEDARSAMYKIINPESLMDELNKVMLH